MIFGYGMYTMAIYVPVTFLVYAIIAILVNSVKLTLHNYLHYINEVKFEP